MSIEHESLFTALASPFEPHEVRERTQGGRTFSYITARVVMNRLDNVLGPAGWWDRYTPGEHSVICELTIRLPDGSTLTKADAGGYAGMSDAGDDEKSGFSDGFKRAAVKFGVGRFLYGDGVPEYAQEAHASAAAADPGPARVGQSYGGARQDDRRDDRRDAPRDDRPYQNGHGNGHGNGNGGGQGGGGGGKKYDGPPKSGKALFAWSKDREQEYQVALIKYLSSWARLQEFPDKMMDWNETQVQLGYAEAVRKLESIGNGKGREEALAN